MRDSGWVERHEKLEESRGAEDNASVATPLFRPLLIFPQGKCVIYLVRHVLYCACCWFSLLPLTPARLTKEGGSTPKKQRFLQTESIRSWAGTLAVFVFTTSSIPTGTIVLPNLSLLISRIFLQLLSPTTSVLCTPAALSDSDRLSSPRNRGQRAASRT